MRDQRFLVDRVLLHCNPIDFLIRTFSRFFLGSLLLFTPIFQWAENDPNSIRILSWNVRNYNLCNRYFDGRFRFNYPKPEVEKNALRKVISELQPDFILLQEMGDEPFLKELIEDLNSECRMEFKHSYCLHGVDDVRHLAVVSLRPFKVVENPINSSESFNYFDQPFVVKRGLLEIETELVDSNTSISIPITLMSFHLKSRFTEDKRDPLSQHRREKEATLIRSYLVRKLEENPGNNILMTGDLNDLVLSRAYRRITEIAGRDILLEVPVFDDNGDVWTHFYEKQRSYEQIDFLFMSPSLKHNPKIEITAQIVENESVRTASDHRPILITITQK